MAGPRSSNPKLLFVFLLIECGAAFLPPAMISYGVAKSICMQQRDFVSRNRGVLHGPLMSPLTQRQPDYCSWIAWNAECRGNSSRHCPIFKGHQCPNRPIKSANGRIVGGKEVVPHSYPSFVSLVLTDNDFCGGVIVDPSWVLTGAHCIPSPIDLDDFGIVAARHSWSSGGQEQQVIPVDKYVKHPDLKGVDGKPAEVDLALIHLKEPLKLNDKVQLANFPAVDWTYGEWDLTVVGRGITDGGVKSNVVQEVAIPILNQETCKLTALGLNYWQFCLQDKQYWHSTCTGDSGGPAYYIDKKNQNKQILVGIVEFGLGECENIGKISGLVSVYRFLRWMAETVRKG